MITLYSYFRSSSAYRVRIALNFKELEYKTTPVHLVKDGGEQHYKDYKKLNALSQVPTLIHDKTCLTQSMAIFYYLDKTFEGPKLFPKEIDQHIIEFCEVINSGIQPIQNLRVLQYLKNNYHLDQDEISKWSQHWIEQGFFALESFLNKNAGLYCFSDQPTAADMFLIPQVYNSLRYNVNLDEFTKIKSIWENCLKHKAFINADPAHQPDTPTDYKSPYKI